MSNFYQRVRRAIIPGSANDQRVDDAGGERDAVRTDGGVVNEDSRGPDFESGSSDRLAAGIDRLLRSDFLESSILWVPPFLLMRLFTYGTVIWNFLISLTDYQRFVDAPDYPNLDFEMYMRALMDSGFIDAAVDTFILLVVFTAGTLAVGLILTILIDHGVRFENSFWTIYLLPMSLSFVVTAQFWLWIYNYNSGIASRVVGLVGVGPISRLGNQTIVFWAVIFTLVWQFSGYAMVVYLAGFRATSDEHYEVAKVDGTSTLKVYWRAIIPQLKGVTINTAIVLMVFGMKVSGFLYSLASGYRPPNGADILATKMVREVYTNLNWAYGAAIAVILFAMALGVIGPYLVYEYRRSSL